MIDNEIARFRFADLFAGFGGLSRGAILAGGELTAAFNHNPVCVKAHAQSHPEASHHCENLHNTDYSRLAGLGLWCVAAAPSCQGHSQAAQPQRKHLRGTKANHDALRATAFCVIQMAEAVMPPVIVVENVPDFARWRLFGGWCSMLESLGYKLTTVTMKASDYGVPQDRKRVFVVATLTDAPLDLDLDAVKAPSPTIGDCVDFEDGTWKPVSRATARVQERIGWAVERHGDRGLTQHVTGHRGRGLGQRFPTITKQDQLAVYKRLPCGTLVYRPLTLRETARGMGFDDDWQIPQGLRRRDVIEGLGNAVPPEMARRLFLAIRAAHPDV